MKYTSMAFHGTVQKRRSLGYAFRIKHTKFTLVTITGGTMVVMVPLQFMNCEGPAMQ